jgi:hypothetical protein
MNFIGNQINISGSGNEIGAVMQASGSQNRQQAPAAAPPSPAAPVQAVPAQLRTAESKAVEEEFLGDDAPLDADPPTQAKRSYEGAARQIELYRRLHQYAETLDTPQKQNKVLDMADALRAELKKQDSLDQEAFKGIVRNAISILDGDTFEYMVSFIADGQNAFPASAQKLAGQSLRFYQSKKDQPAHA